MQKKHHALGTKMIALAAGSVVLGLGLYTPAAYGSTLTTATWSGGGGTDTTWTNAANWTGGDYTYTTGTGTAIPGTDQNIDIGGSSTAAYYVVNTPFPSPGYKTSGALTIEAGSTLYALDGQNSLSVDGGLNSNAATDITGAGTGLNNAGILGTITAGPGWGINLGGGAAQSSDYSTNTGTIEAINGSTFALNSSIATGGIINTGGTIRVNGYTSGTNTFSSVLTVTGQITGGSFSIDNQYAKLTLASPGSEEVLNGVQFSNAGSLNVSETTVSQLNGAYIIAQKATNFTNSGIGTFTFFGTVPKSVVGLVIGGASADSIPNATQLNAGVADGSTFNNSNTLTFENKNSKTTASTVSVEFDLNTNGPTASAVTNNGAINFITDPAAVADGSSTSLRLGHDATINGSGTLVFNDAATNFVGTMNGTTGVPTLTLGAGQTLSGAVLLGNSQVGITNHGTIHANGVNPIVIATAGGNSFTNYGTLQVDNGSEIKDTDSGLTLSTGSNVAIAIDSDTDTSGLINVTGALDLTASPTLSATDIGSTTLGSGVVFTLIDPTSITGTFAGYANGSIYTVGTNNFVVGYGNNEVTLTSTTFVPEPASLSLLAVGALGLLRRRRREIA